MPAKIQEPTYRRMSWRNYSPSWPYPPAAPVWGCPGGERGRNERPHIRAIRWGTILLLSSKERGVNVGHSGRGAKKQHSEQRKETWGKTWNRDKRHKGRTRVRHSHLYWCYLGNLSLNPSTSPVNWCRGWWGFAAYFLLHWRREKEPKSTHRLCFCPCGEVRCPASPPPSKNKNPKQLRWAPRQSSRFTSDAETKRNEAEFRNGERRHLSLSSFPSLCWCSPVLGCCCMRRRMTSALGRAAKNKPVFGNAVESRCRISLSLALSLLKKKQQKNSVLRLDPTCSLFVFFSVFADLKKCLHVSVTENKAERERERERERGSRSRTEELTDRPMNNVFKYIFF